MEQSASQVTDVIQDMFGVALGGGRFLEITAALRGCAVSVVWRDAIIQLLQEAANIDLHRFDVSDSIIEVLAKRCPNARRINLYSCRRVTDQSLRVLSQACLKLTELNLTGIPSVTPEGVDVIVTGCKQLETLHLAGCDRISESIVVARYAKFCDIFDEEEEGPWTA
eukprot:TRINITY_DN107285_c0_g1_i1.p1 TRINITY_DN107285_c0_g1~~TRINITY_DN107285_c0_g1_i1.p1  ORF type:complete len:167 (-),score=17.66 TRINITY_DN107285_c0_g1_i1:527-1027(-)